MESLADKFGEILDWERRKRREETLAAGASSALALAIFCLPLNSFLPAEWLRWLVPVVWFMILAPWLFCRARWRHHDGVRAIVTVDKKLMLAERAVTAWELSRDPDRSGAGLLVLQQAEAKLRDFQTRAQLPRRLSWLTYAVVPLLVLWIALLGFGFDRANSTVSVLANRTLAHRVQEYARELQEKARNEGLPDTLKLGRELEKTAQQSLAAKTPEESFKKELAGVAQKFETAKSSKADKNPFATGESEQSLQDLKAELEASKSLFQLPSAAGGDVSDQQWMERLSALPNLKRQFDNADRGGQGMSRNEMKAFLDKLDQQTTTELDRRSVLDAEQYLEQMMKQGPGEKGESYARSSAGSGQEDPNAAGTREKSFSNLPGKEPGKSDETVHSLPEVRPGASSQVKGQLGVGESSAVLFKGTPTGGKSELSAADVVASYRRQAEQELNSESVPESLKETIKNYFTSLEEAKR